VSAKKNRTRGLILARGPAEKTLVFCASALKGVPSLYAHPICDFSSRFYPRSLHVQEGDDGSRRPTVAFAGRLDRSFTASL
jgi:hypothetical protein